MTETRVIERALRYVKKWGKPPTIRSAVCTVCGEIWFTLQHASIFGDQRGACSLRCRDRRKLKGRIIDDGEAYVNKMGYVLRRAPGHPKAGKGQRVLEHVLVMEKKIGRFLRRGENVHHLNGLRSDNRPENLELWVKTQLGGQRVEDLLGFISQQYPVEMLSLIQKKLHCKYCNHPFG